MNKQKLENAKKLFFILLGVDIFVTVIVLISYFWEIGILKDVSSGVVIADASLISTVGFWDNFVKVILLTTIGVGVGLVKWLDACYKYAKEALGASSFKQEGWTTAGWILPVMNLFKPYQVINEIYKTGGSSYQNSDDWKKENGSGLLLTWWIFYAITHLIGSIAAKQLLKDTNRVDMTLQQSINSIEFSSVFCVVSLIIAGLWFFVAGCLTRRLLSRSSVPLTAPSPKAIQVAAVNSPKEMPSPVVTPASPFNQSPLTNQHIQANFAASKASISVTSDDLWAQALAEYDSGSRNQGLWARLFSEAQGNEAAVKANYMRIRVDEMQHLKSLEVISEEQREYDALPRGACPSCKMAILPITTTTCPKCWSKLGPHSPFKLRIDPISQLEQINALRLIVSGGNKLTEYEAELLKRG